MKTAVIVLADGFEEIEAVTPVDLLRRAGVKVVVAGLGGLSVTGRSGLTLGCECTLDQVEPGWDALILPGGLPGASTLARSPLVQDILKDTFARGAWVAAICAAPALVLGGNGWLEGRTFTGYPGTEGEARGGRYVVETVVVDGTVVTSRGVGTAAAFSLKLVELLAGPEKAAETAASVLLG